MVYEFKTRVKLFQTDAAGKLFFSNLFIIAHECYENYLHDNKIKISDIIAGKKFLIPVVHAEADYINPIYLDDLLLVKMDAKKIGDHSFTLNFDIKKQNGDVAANITTVHVTTGYSSGKSILLPENIKSIIGKLIS